jgi:glyoxylase-like metal-dependent hydrolase (beta-lactamase superfamily II)
MSKTIVTAVFLVLTCAAHAQTAPEATIRIEPVIGSVHVLYGEGGNIGISVGDDGVFLIDDQYERTTPKIEAALAGLRPGQPRFVINTHWHGDHTGGNANFAAKGSVIIAHDRVRERMGSDQYSEFLKHATPASKPGALPVITFNDSLSLHVNGDELRGTHVPSAHTDGDTFIHFRKANVIHAGDLFFNGLYPFIDLDSGGSVKGLIAGVDRVLELADGKTRIIPGHGKVTDRAGLEAYRKMLADTSGRVEALVKAGKSLDEVLAAKPNADYDATLAWDFITADRFARTLYEDARRRIK